MRNRADHSGIGLIFAFLLLGMFAVASLFLTVLGVRVYKDTAAAYTRHNTERILSSYLRSMVRSMDAEDTVSVQVVDGVQTLCFTEIYDGQAYLTRLYCSGGKLREWFSGEAYGFVPEDGTEICDAASLSVSLENGLIRAVLLPVQEGDPIDTQVKVFCAGAGA